jgi:hypothetical protein
MENTFLVDIHSIIDVITNSSSELFISSKDTDVSFVREFLEDIISIENKYENRNTKFYDYFDEPYLLTEENIDSFLNDGSWFLSESYKMPFKQQNEPYDNYMERVNEYEKNWVRSVNKDDYIGKVVIKSASDNTIPYHYFELISSVLNAKRYHLG